MRDHAQQTTPWRRYARLALLAGGVWLGATLFNSAMVYVSYIGVGKDIWWVLWSSAVRFAVWGATVPPLLWLVRRFPLNQGSWPRQAAKLLLVALIVSPIVSLAQMALVHWTYFPYRAQAPTLWIAIGNGSLNYAGELFLGLGLIVALQAWQMFEDFRAERTRALQLERQLAVSRLDTLRMQLQPHFLFNSLHTIAGLIGEEPQSARRMVVALGDLLRLTLKDAPRCMRSLAEELAFIDHYMEVLRYRMGDRLALDYAIEPDITRAEVPSLLLQPLFENAVRHGVSRVNGPCTIGFRAWREEDRLHISIENDGPIATAAATASATTGATGSTAGGAARTNGHAPAHAAGTRIGVTAGSRPRPVSGPGRDAAIASPAPSPSPWPHARSATSPNGNGTRRGVGLSNTLARLDMQYGGDFTFSYLDRSTGGARVDMSWPYRLAKSDVDEEHDDGAAGAYAAR